MAPTTPAGSFHDVELDARLYQGLRGSDTDLGDRVVALLRELPDLTSSHLLRVADRMAWAEDAEVMRAAAPALLAHPACTDRVVLELFRLPQTATVFRRVLWARETVPHWHFGAATAAAVTAVAEARHPVAGALALVSCTLRYPHLQAVLFETALETAVELRGQAAAHGVGAPALTGLLLTLLPSWTGTVEQLRDFATTVLTRTT